MNNFSLCFDGLCLTGQSILHILFVSRLTGKKQKAGLFAAYFFLLCTIEWVFTRYALSELWAIGAQLLVLFGISCLALKNQLSVSWAAAVLAVYISQLSFGIVNSVEVIIFPNFIGRPLLYLLLLSATLAAFLLCTFCYMFILNILPRAEDSQLPYIGLLLFPGLFFFAAELYILHTSYRILPSSISLADYGKHAALLFLQSLGLGALFCTLYAYRHLFHNMQAQAAVVSLRQAVQAQKAYIAEAQIRDEQTRAFRHDIKNHLSVLGGLLNGGKLEESKAYLQKLKMASAPLSFPYQTGNAVVDILLGEKLGLAKANQITAEVSLLLPKPCRIDDFDLCVIFANALDNAIHACSSAEEERLIQIRGEMQGDFYMLAFENTCDREKMFQKGTGLSNIQSVAQKYHGAMLTEKANGYFSLHVLLNISLHPDNISVQKP